MLVKGPKTSVKTLPDSEYISSIFTDKSKFRDKHVYKVPAQIAGGLMYSYGRGTVGHLQNCLHVTELNMRLLSTHNVTQYIDVLVLCLNNTSV
jgi:hypothetical protein